MKALKTIFLSTFLFLLLNQENIHSWNNGPSGDSSTDEDHPLCENIPYSTHDWIADHARAFLPDEQRKWIDDNKKLYLLGTEAPANDDIPDTCNSPNNGYDDRNQGIVSNGNQTFLILKNRVTGLHSGQRVGA